MNKSQLRELLLQALEHEKGGIQVYQTALECAVNEDLKEEWEEYLAQTEIHAERLTGVCESMGYDPAEMTPGRKIVQQMGKSLVQAMKAAQAAGDPAAAELVACDCVVLAETKDHANWKLIGKCAEAMNGDGSEELAAAYDEIEDQEDEHLYHSKGWGRELWLKSLGINAVLPPPEEQKDVKSAAAAAKAERAVTR